MGFEVCKSIRDFAEHLSSIGFSTQAITVLTLSQVWMCRLVSITCYFDGGLYPQIGVPLWYS